MPYIGEAKEENLDSLIHPENNHEELSFLPLNFLPFSCTQVSTDWSTEGGGWKNDTQWIFKWARIEGINDTISSHKCQYLRLKKSIEKANVIQLGKNSPWVYREKLSSSFSQNSWELKKWERGKVFAEKRVSFNSNPKARLLINRPCCGNFSQFENSLARISHRHSSTRRRWYLLRNKVDILCEEFYINSKEFNLLTLCFLESGKQYNNSL